MTRYACQNNKAYDLFSPKFKANPFATYARMRDEAPVYAHQAPDGSTIWYITRYEDVLQVLQDNVNYCKDPRNCGVPGLVGSAARRTATQRLINENMLFSDPPEHTRLRALVSQAFAPQRVEQMSGFILDTAERLLQEMSGRGKGDLISAYALPLPVIVICELLGIPDADRGQVAVWSQGIISPGSRNLNYSRRKEHVQALVRYLDRMFARRLRRPEDDLISNLVHADQAGDRLSSFELSSMVALLLVTGHETTVNLIGNGALALLANPQQLVQLKEEPQLWETAVEELLRYDGPVETSTSRWARRDVSLRGCLIRRADLVRVVLASANRDPAQFYAADELRVDRQDNKHVAFGYGIHYCLGAALARLEGRVALQALFNRLSHLSLQCELHMLRWRSGVLFRGLQSLDVTWQNSGTGHKKLQARK